MLTNNLINWVYTYYLSFDAISKNHAIDMLNKKLDDSNESIALAPDNEEYVSVFKEDINNINKALELLED